MAHTHAMPGMDGLPPELVTETLSYLDYRDLRAAAAVSRAFRSAAWRAGYYVHYRVNVYDNAARVCAALQKAVERVVKKDLRLGLTIDFRSVSRDAQECRSRNPSLQHPEHRILSLISTALPVLVSLSVEVPAAFFATLVDALRHPAQHLRLMELRIRLGQEAELQLIPADLFAGTAPKLRQVHLAGVTTPLDRVPAFSLVDTVTVVCQRCIPEIDYPRHFPLLRDLKLKSWRSFDGVALPHTLRLAGAALQRLTVEEEEGSPLMPIVRNSINLADIRDVEHITNRLDWQDPLWTRADDGPVSVRVTEEFEGFKIRVIIVPAHRGWRRAYCVWHTSDEDAPAPLPAIGMPGGSERIAYLRMDSECIGSFLRCRGVALHALRTLQIDLFSELDWYVRVWPRAFEPPPPGERVSKRNRRARRRWHYVDCSALETLVLSAKDVGESEEDVGHAVEADEIVYLARALAQCRRIRKHRAALVLDRVELSAVPPVKRTFSAIRQYGLTPGESRDGGDSGLCG